MRLPHKPAAGLHRGGRGLTHDWWAAQARRPDGCGTELDPIRAELTKNADVVCFYS